MSGTETSRQLVTDMYAAAGRMDFETFLSYISDDLVLREPDFTPYGGTYHGKPGMLEAMEKIGKYVNVAQMEVRYSVAEDNRVMTVIAVPECSSGEELLVIEESVIREGKVAELTIFVHEARALAFPAVS